MAESSLLEMMKTRSLLPTSIRVVKHRKRQRAAGRAFVYLNLPKSVVRELDCMKKERRLRSRSAVVETIVAFFLEKQQQSEHQPEA
jgi:hypothetical protein